MKYYKSLFILIVLVCESTISNGQVQLQSIKISDCKNCFNAYTLKAIYKQVWLNDSILEIETTASANCIGVYNPRIKTHGPLLWLEFDEFKVDTCISPFTHKRGEHIEANCICVFQITWTIRVMKKGTDYILLLNRQMSSDYNKELLDKLLSKYEIEDNVKYFFLRNAIDKKGLKQGIQNFRNESDGLTYDKLYHDGVEQTADKRN